MKHSCTPLIQAMPTSTRTLRLILPFGCLWLGILSSASALPTPPALKGIPVPKVAGLENGPEPIIRDPLAARQLGKALFWDTQVGQDGVACATCHFHAGADRRYRNQLDSGSKHLGSAASNTFEPLPSGAPGGPNSLLRKKDFPLFRLENPIDNRSKILFMTDDVVSSAGVFSGRLGDTLNTDGQRPCVPVKDPLFHAGDVNTRRVSVRNTPTVINAAYNYRNFWDGRANNAFNGVNPYGPRDPKAGVWVQNGPTLAYRHLLLENSSLASQAVAPPLDDREMSCQGQRFMDLARKLLPATPLATQRIDPNDSLLASLRTPEGSGLEGRYEDLIRKAFHPRFWSAKDSVPITPETPDVRTSQLAANFAFFFGLAIQSYEDTLISDETRFDGPRDAAGYPVGLTDRERKGLDVFRNECILCHQGPTFTAAADPGIYSGKGARRRLVDRREINGDFDGQGLAVALVDIGYSNTSVTPTDFDIGLGGTDPYGNPLSFSEQYFQTLRNPDQKIIDLAEVRVCDFQRPFHMDFTDPELIAHHEKACADDPRVTRIPSRDKVDSESQTFERGRLLTAVKGAFKIPGLRNVELTGPYMHNGSLKNLDEVLSFYDRGGNVSNPHHIGNLVFPRPFPEEDKKNLILFLKSLTDERVRWERAPFDHPEIRISDGTTLPSAGVTDDRATVIPAVGRDGRAATLGPLKPFEAYLPD